MAVVKGTSAGFVLVAPVDDPGGTSSGLDGWARAIKDTSPAGATSITEIGWWCDAVSASSNFEVGLYDHDADNNKPGNRLYVDNVNAVGSGGTWQSVSVDWAISAETVYWIAVQVDAAAGSTDDNWSTVSGERTSQISSSGTLNDPWGTSSQSANLLMAYYAVYSATSFVEIAGEIASTSAASGTITLGNVVSISGTVASTSTVGGALGAELVIASDWQSTSFSSGGKRLIALGNDALYYEDI